MHDDTFDAAARRAATVSRRGSIRLLGGAWLAGLFAGSPHADAGKADKNVRRQCNEHARQCRAGVEDYCAKHLPDEPTCGTNLAPCCEHFAQCRADLGVECLVTGQPQPAAR